MQIKVDSISFYIRTTKNEPEGKIPIIFLHGFTGSSKDWDFITDNLPQEFFPVAIDLIGHGQTESPKELEYYSTIKIIKYISEIIDTLNFRKVILCGYSMGGRAALSFSLKNSQKLLGLILESTTAGIKEEERNARIKSDYQLADTIENEGVENFITNWMKQPLFEQLNSIGKEKYEEIVKQKMSNSVIGLVNSLRGFSTGVMPGYWKYLNMLRVPTLLITGELDKKFTEINSQMSKLIPYAEHHIVSGSCHNVHLEKPEEFIILVKDFLRNFY